MDDVFDRLIYGFAAVIGSVPKIAGTALCPENPLASDDMPFISDVLSEFFRTDVHQFLKLDIICLHSTLLVLYESSCSAFKISSRTADEIFCFCVATSLPKVRRT